MRRRLYFVPILIIVLILLIVGSLYDLTISQNIVQLRNGFSIFFAGITGVPLGFVLGFISGNLISYYKKYKVNYSKWWQYLFNIGFILAFAAGSIIITGSQMVSYHAFNLNKFIMIPLGLIILIPSLILGYKLFNKFDKPFYIKWLIFICIVAAIPLGIVTVTKLIAPRIRYTTLVQLNGIINDGFSYFRPWYAPGVNKDEIKAIVEGAGLVLEKEAFKSFPSGHTTLAWSALPFCCSLMIFNKKFVKYDYLFFFGYIIFVGLVIFSRIFIGAHYLSDTMFASLVCVMVFYIGYEIYIRKLRFGLDEAKQ